jgi:hypothetical protein
VLPEVSIEVRAPLVVEIVAGGFHNYNALFF